MKTIGIIGGMGPLATVHLFERIVLRTKAEKDQDHIRIIIDNNTNIPDRTKAILGQGESPVNELVRSAKMLEKSGADFLIMPCNTAHYFIDQIKKNVEIPLINMPEEAARYTCEKYGKDAVVGIMATDGTIKTKIYENYYNELGIKTLIPVRTQAHIMEFIYDVIKKGNYGAGPDLFFKCLEELKELGANVFLLGCTELSAAQYLYKFEGSFINPMEVLAEKAILYAGGDLNKDGIN
ncbi:MAG TPA: amino acid racemase [Sedimentibacter sp.]|nr:amino acid racemase [Sedimentibacter sp.]HHZ00040.1 amino acid racemase [Tissierellia bacterium]HOK49495.1 amino acid racemase [Sedimentibacter sp.]HOW23824.1 amino acid racemase [Sedimentibacter sp.]HRC81629.1 amino acid racemase [Sedimentibacter sp.]